MRVLLVRPRPWLVDHVLDSPAEDKFDLLWVRRYPPVGMAHCAAFLERAGHQVKIVDGETLWLPVEAAKLQAVEFKPDLVIGQVNWMNPVDDHMYVSAVARAAGAPLVVRGHLARSYPVEAASLEGVTAALVGKGLQSAADLADALAGGRDLHEVKGIAFKHGDDVVTTSAEDLGNPDSWPYPARHLLDNDAYLCLAGRRHPFTTLHGSGGCPHRCIYCVDSKTRYWARSGLDIVEEMKQCQKDFGTKEFTFLDPMFNITKARTAEVCEAIIESSLDCSFTIKARADTIDCEMARLLARAGCTRVGIGIESGSDEVLRGLGRDMELGTIESAVRNLKAVDITVMGYVQVGNMGETWDTFSKTMDFVLGLGLDLISIGVTLPMPGTDIHRLLLEEGRPDPWLLRLRVPPRTPVDPETTRPPGVEADRVTLEKWRDHLYQRFFVRPSYLMSMAFGKQPWISAMRLPRAGWVNLKTRLTGRYQKHYYTYKRVLNPPESPGRQ